MCKTGKIRHEIVDFSMLFNCESGNSIEFFIFQTMFQEIATHLSTQTATAHLYLTPLTTEWLHSDGLIETPSSALNDE